MTLVLIVFVSVFVIVLLCVGLGMAFLETRQRKQVRLMLQTAKPVNASERAALVRDAGREDAFALWLRRFPPAIKMESLLQQSLLGWTIGRLSTMSLAGLAIGGFLGFQLNLFSARAISCAALGALGFFLPILYMLRKRSKIFNAFEKQFPDALDFL